MTVANNSYVRYSWKHSWPHLTSPPALPNTIMRSFLDDCCALAALIIPMAAMEKINGF